MYNINRFRLDYRGPLEISQ